MVKNCTMVFKEVCSIINGTSGNYVQEAMIICCHVLNVNRGDLLICDLSVDESLYETILAMARKRKDGYPLQYLVGEWEFYGRPYYVGEGVLIPRADTETLIEAVLSRVNRYDSANIADLCSGSGCIAVTLDCELSNSRVCAIEKSELAFSYLERNIKLNNSSVRPILADVLDFHGDIERLDIVVSNPPYLTDNDMELLQKEVSFEPEMALYGESDGLYFYREITKRWVDRIKSGGMLFYEIGMGQENDICVILKEYGFKNICQKADLCGIIRVVYGTKI